MELWNNGRLKDWNNGKGRFWEPFEYVNKFKDIYFLRRRRAPAKPASPEPRSIIVAGSGA